MIGWRSNSNRNPANGQHPLDSPGSLQIVERNSAFDLSTLVVAYGGLPGLADGLSAASCAITCRSAYGLISGAYPSALSFYYGVVNYGRMLGRLITASGVAGLLAPWLAGAIFDAIGGYGLAVSLACSGAALAFLVSAALARVAEQAASLQPRGKPEM